MDRYKEVDGVKYKRCSSHKDYVPMTDEFFSKRSASKDGYAYSCKECERKTAAKSYQKRLAKQRAQERYELNKEEYLERARERYQENKEEILEDAKKWRATKQGQKVMKAAGQRRRNRIKEQTPGGRDYVREEIIKRDSVFGECICQICGVPIDLEGENPEMALEIDHIIPIAQGGSDTKDNVRCTHKICNNTRPKDGRDLEAQ